MECKVRLEAFEGPLDLLLHLIRKNQIDIRDIPMALITEQYLEYLRLMRSLNLEVASEYLVMAATLVHIKSRMLLPRVDSLKDEDQEDDSQEDPRAELVSKLVEYQKYKEAAEVFKTFPVLGRDVFPRPPSNRPDTHDAELSWEELSIVDIVEVFARLMAQRQVEEGLRVDLERVSLVDKIQEISDVISKKKGGMFFDELFPENPTRRDIILTFLALLEMVKLRMVRVFQSQPLGAIRVMRV